MRTLLAVLTCERPGVSYLEQTIASLERAGADTFDGHKLICCDGQPGPDAVRVRREVPGWQTAAWPAAGNKYAFWNTLAIGAEYDRLIYVEDDVAVCRGAVTAAARLEVPPELAYVSLFAMTNAVPVDARPGLHRCPHLDARGRTPGWGTQALVLERPILEYLVSRRRELEAFRLRHGSDFLFSRFLATGPRPAGFGVVVPNWAEHVGAVSAILPGGAQLEGRTSSTWRGPDFDALTWRPELAQEAREGAGQAAGPAPPAGAS